MIRRTKRLVRLTGASLALVVALALGAGPVVAAQERGFAGCLVEAARDFVECMEGADGFWDHVGCGAVAILDGFGCVSDAITNAF
ncbi:MAG: hypothetical protein F4151_04790 [Gammaproteobacteria bacterium]|nr:hypothetical protein [Gammaproteobacteria bacterium]